jgi:hypothetical protein
MRALNCPRCGAPLYEKEPDRRWLRFFECSQCWLAFEVVVERHMAPCGNDPGRKFLRHTFTLLRGRTRGRKNAIGADLSSSSLRRVGT